uniref:hypothetical protein n=1 Tax=Sphingomonas populi TaxID=2484750 RepID=UPI001E4709B2|nr:hypothetical protein [Sphingomonas populi]
MGVQLTRTQKLKVYRTPIGFHDAYVAAPSQKAALAAWGSDHDLFARGIAELVEDPDLTREPLAKPGEVIRRSRGTTAEQIAALPPDRPKRAREAAAEPPRPAPKAKPKPKPRPDRAPLDAARAALDDVAARHRRERDTLGEREAALARERRETEKRQAAEVAALRAEAEQAQTAYDAAMQAWRG